MQSGPDGKKVYVASEDYDTVSVIDSATNTITDDVDVGSSPDGVAVSPDGTKLYVANYENDSISVIDTATNTVTATVAVGSGPSEIAIGNLAVSNANGTTSKTATIDVQEESSSSGISSGSHSNGNSGSGLKIASNDQSSSAISGSTGNITEIRTEIQPENNTGGVEQENGTTVVNVEPKSEQTQTPNVSKEGSTKTPDFEIISGIFCLFAVFLYKRK